MDQTELDFLTQQKIELLLNMKTKKFEEQLGNLKQELNMLQGHLSQLRQELNSRPTMPVSKEPLIRSAEPTPTPTVPTPAPIPIPTVKKESHPRQGDYNSDDVSIEKYFNFSGR
jgi:hypothetical protein